MVFDPNKQKVSTNLCPPAQIVLGSTWLISQDGLILGTPVFCTPVNPPYLLAPPYTLALQPTPIDGRCWWFVESGPFTGTTPYSSIQLLWGTGLPIADSWLINMFNSSEPSPGNPLIQQTQYVGPSTQSPTGTYAAVQDDYTPSVCADPLTLIVS